MELRRRRKEIYFNLRLGDVVIDEGGRYERKRERYRVWIQLNEERVTLS